MPYTLAQAKVITALGDKINKYAAAATALEGITDMKHIEDIMVTYGITDEDQETIITAAATAAADELDDMITAMTTTYGSGGDFTLT